MALNLLQRAGRILGITGRKNTSKRPARPALTVERLEDRTLLSTSYGLDFSTYLGGNQFEQARDVQTDSQGNVYVTGGTRSTNFPDSPSGAAPIYRYYSAGYNGVGSTDIFVSKFNPTGQLLWSALIGGPGYERTYALEIDSQGNVIGAGRGGPGTYLENAMQTQFQGYFTNSGYGDQNAYLFKLNANGDDMLFATYTGTGTLSRDMAVDASGDIFLATHYDAGTAQQRFETLPQFAGKFTNAPIGGTDSVVVKIESDGSQVLWATYVGGTLNESHGMSIRVGPDGSPYLLTNTPSADVATGSLPSSYHGGTDLYLAKLSPNGTTVQWGLQMGGSGDEGTETHHLWVDGQGTAYVTGGTTSANIVTTTGKTLSGPSDVFIAKVTSAGSILASTLFGGTNGDGTQGVAVDALGNVYIGGGSQSTGLATAGAYDTTHAGGEEGYAAVLSPDLATVLYATYLGGPNNDQVRSLWADANGSFVVVGHSDGPGWPTKNAHDPTYNPSSTGSPTDKTDAVVAKFSPVAASPGSVQFALSSWTVNEAVGTATFSLTRTGGSTGAISVTVSSSDGTATSGADYTPISKVVSWADGVSGSKNVTIRIKEDTLAETSETINLTLTNATGGATLGNPSTATMTITDNDSTATTIQVYSTAGDGRLDYFGAPNSGGGQAQWNAAHSSPTGGPDHTSAHRSNWVGSGMLGGGSTSGAVSIMRGFLAFDTSAIPDGATILSATLNVFVTGKRNDLNDGNDFLSVVEGFQASPLSLTGTDYTKAGNSLSNPIEGSNRVDITSISTNGYVSWTLNAAGRGWISKNGFTMLAMREGHDLLNIWGNYAKGKGNTIDAYMSEQGLTLAPYLEITYA